MQVRMFEYQHGFGSIREQITEDLNYFLDDLHDNDFSYEIKYISTGKGMIAIVEYQDEEN